FLVLLAVPPPPPRPTLFPYTTLFRSKPFLSDDVYATFATVVEDRAEKGFSINATFVGLRELKLVGAEFDNATKEGEITVRFVGEDRKSTRLNSSHVKISYAVFCLKKK